MCVITLLLLCKCKISHRKNSELAMPKRLEWLPEVKQERYLLERQDKLQKALSTAASHVSIKMCACVVTKGLCGCY